MPDADTLSSAPERRQANTMEAERGSAESRGAAREAGAARPRL